MTCFHLGEFLASRAHLEQALARFDPAHRPFYMSFHIFQDPLVALLNYLSNDLICLGYLDQARTRMEAAVREASKLGHAYGLAIALTRACWVDWATGSREELLARADALLVVSDEHGFPYSRAAGTVFRGWALAGNEQTGEGIALLEAGVAAFRATGAVTEVPFCLTLLADAEGRAKERDQGLSPRRGRAADGRD